MQMVNVRRGAAVVALVAVPTTAVAGGVAAAAATRKSTTLSIRAAHSAVAPHTKDTISGVLKSSGTPLKSMTVSLRERQAGTKSWSAVSSAATNAKGAVSFSVVPPHQREQYQLLFGGTSTYAPSHSAVVTVSVKRPTSLSIGAAHTTVKPKAKDTISGILRSGRTGLTGENVTLRERKAGTAKWSIASSGKTGTSGRITFTVTPPNNKEQYDLVFGGTSRYFGSHSGIVTVTVS